MRVVRPVSYVHGAGANMLRLHECHGPPSPVPCLVTARPLLVTRGNRTGKSFNPGEQALKCAPKLGAKAQKDDAIAFFKNIKKTPSAPARSGKSLEIEKFLRQVAAENGIKINFDKCPGGACMACSQEEAC